MKYTVKVGKEIDATFEFDHSNTGKSKEQRKVFFTGIVVGCLATVVLTLSIVILSKSEVAAANAATNVIGPVVQYLKCE